MGINFKNYPPENAVANFKPGDWVYCEKHGLFGVVSDYGGGLLVSVEWTNGCNAQVMHSELKQTGANAFLERLKLWAEEKLNMNAEQVWAIHMPLANGKDKLLPEVLFALEKKLVELSLNKEPTQEQADVEYEATWEAIENAPTIETVPDVFAQFGVDDATGGDDGDSLLYGGNVDGCADSGNNNVEAQEETPKSQSADAVAASESTAQEHGETTQGQGTAAQTPAHTANEGDSANTPPASATSQDNAIRTEAGLIDPITGEMLEPSLIMRKFGWTEMPMLSNQPTREALNAFEEKLDQVTERIFEHLDKVARWTAANELKCKPYVEAAAFWEKNFVEPMSKMLAPHRLPRFQSGAKAGQYSKKTLVLKSGCIEFRADNGGAFVHDDKELKAYMQKEGLEKFKAVGADLAVVYDYKKLIAALNKGTLKNLPGTGMSDKNELATVKLVSPAEKAAKAKAKKGGDEDGE